MTGTIIDTATKRPLADVVVTVTSPSLQGEQTVVTDKSGSYRIPSLPPGPYTLRLEGDGYKPYSRGGIVMRIDATIRVNAELLPEGLKAEEVVVVGKAPTVDVGSSSTGVTLNQDFVSRIALNAPGGKDSASKSFESLALVAPGANGDTYGVSIAGTTSPENAFIIDGVAVNDPAYGINGTPLSSEFVKEMGVITGGYLPEYGKATGGVMDVVTKSGGNEFHGDAWVSYTPGSLHGPQTLIQSASQAISGTVVLSNERNFGADIGGYFIKDRLWFYAGAQFSGSEYTLERTLSQFEYKGAPGMQTEVTDPNTGFPSPVIPLNCPTQVAGPQQFGGTGAIIQPGNWSQSQCMSHGLPAAPVLVSNSSSIQYIGKLTFLINQDHSLTFSFNGTPSSSGGNGEYPQGQGAGIANTGSGPLFGIAGPYSTTGSKLVADANDLSLKYSGAFNNKRQLIDITAGWHHQHLETDAADGSGPQQTTTAGTIASVPGLVWQQNTPDFHQLGFFEPQNVPRGACQPASTVNGPVGTCPILQYFTGGPGFLSNTDLDSYQARAVFTDLLQAAGHHVIKAGADTSYNDYTHYKAYSGENLLQESTSAPNLSGFTFSDFRNYGFMTAPDQAFFQPYEKAHSDTFSWGAFLQDSWQIFDKVTLNVGVRYDGQIIYGTQGQVGLTLPSQWSPRIGLIYDFTQQGRSKIYANYARYYEGVPLDAADRSFPSESSVLSYHGGACAPTPGQNLQSPTAAGPQGPCTTNANRLPLNGADAPSRFFIPLGGTPETIDPNLKPQATDEFVVGGEYEIFADARLGVSYTHRDMVDVIEDMSNDEAKTYFVGNPGYGIAADFPKATRNYDAFTIYFQKTYANTWLAQASYTLSRLYGNYAGLFRPETGQLDPNITSDFDLRSLLPNTTGPLPGDTTHVIKIFGAKDFLIPGGQDILLGLTYAGASGTPLDAFGAHILYGPNEVFVVPRGTGGTLVTRNVNASNYGAIQQERNDWIHDIDMKLGYSIRLAKDTVLGLTMDIFNLFDFQGVAGRDETYTLSPVFPCQTGTLPTCVQHSASATPFNPKTEVNPNYGNPVAYQAPRQFRFGARVTF